MSASISPVTLFSLVARTATPTPAEFAGGVSHGLHLVIDVTAVTDTPSVAPTLAFYDPLSGKWCTLLTGAAITATGTTVLKVYPGITAVPNVSSSDVIHGRMRLSMTHADADSITYCAAAHLLG